MKWIVIATLLAGCTDDANIGISNEPITCQQGAAGVANGTVSNPYTQMSYSFGTTSASLLAGPGTATAVGVSLTDSALLLDLQFSCGMELGNYDVGTGQNACPHLVNSTVSGNLQQVYGSGASGLVILDQNVGCLAGRYDVNYVLSRDVSGTESVGEVSGWFSVPLQ